MKQLFRGLALIVAAVLFALAVSGCIADRARGKTLLPAARLAWPGVHSDIDRGVADGVEDGDMDALYAGNVNLEVGRLDSALQSGKSPLFARVNWMILEPIALRGIQDKVDDGELSPEAAGSFRERVWNFHDALAGLGAPVTTREE